MSRQLHDRQIEHWAYVRRTDDRNTRLAMFVHGFRGSYLSTWGQLADQLENRADADDTLRVWDYVFLGYETHSLTSYLDIARLIATQWRRASAADPPYAPNQYTTLALFGHSLGTLGIRQLLCAPTEQPEGILDVLKSVVLIGSPINGSPLAPFAGLLRIAEVSKGKFGALSPNAFAIAESLRQDSAPLRMLYVWNKCARRDPKAAGIRPRVIKGTDDFVVGDGGLVTWDGDQDPETLPLDHRQLSKSRSGGGSQLWDLIKAALK